MQLSRRRNCRKSVKTRATRERAAIVTREMEGATDIMATTTTKAATKGTRDIELKKMLEDRRRELLDEVQGKIRDGRRDSTKEREVLDQGESSEVDIQEEIEFALIQMKAETLNKIDVALRRLEEGTYGGVSSAATRSPKRASEPFRSRCGARIVKKLVRRPSSVSACRSVAAPQRSSSTWSTNTGARHGQGRHQRTGTNRSGHAQDRDGHAWLGPGRRQRPWRVRQYRVSPEIRHRLRTL